MNNQVHDNFLEIKEENILISGSEETHKWYLL